MKVAKSYVLITRDGPDLQQLMFYWSFLYTLMKGLRPWLKYISKTQTQNKPPFPLWKMVISIPGKYDKYL